MSLIVQRLLVPLPALLGGGLALLLAVLYLDHGVAAPLAIVGGLLVVVLALYLGGAQTFADSPYKGGLLMEAGFGVQFLVAAAAGAVLIALGIDQAIALGDDATEREKAVATALAALVTAYAEGAFVKPEGKLWNPVKAAIGKRFGDSFTQRSDALEKDARAAIQEERYGGLAEEHKGHVVDGWGWDARRLRTRHIDDQVNRG